MEKDEKINTENAISILENEFINKGLSDLEDCVYIRSSKRYYNFLYGIVELKGLLYNFVLNLHTNDIIQERIEGDIIGTYGEKDIREKEYREEEYIYEKLGPGEILIISRQKDSFLVAENDNAGLLHLKRIKIEEEKKD